MKLFFAAPYLAALWDSVISSGLVSIANTDYNVHTGTACLVGHVSSVMTHHHRNVAIHLAFQSLRSGDMSEFK